jgi:glycosyltransferase involved in cell wall biosynthesis
VRGSFQGVSLIRRFYWSIQSHRYRGAIRAVRGGGLFDGAWYLASNPDVAGRGVDPAAHFCVFGHQEGRNPHPLFLNGYYRAQLPLAERAENPLLHYLGRGSARGLSPHPLFDPAHYAGQLDGASPAGGTALEHFALTGAPRGLDPHPDFDTSFYVEMNPEVLARGLNPLEHFVAEGWREGKRPAPRVSARGLFERYPALQRAAGGLPEAEAPPASAGAGPLDELRNAGALLDRIGQPASPVLGAAGRRKLFFVTHSAGRSGAPLILLRIVEAFAAGGDCDCFVFCGEGGPLIHELRRHGWVIDCSKIAPDRTPVMEAVESAIAGPRPAAALCNSANSGWFAAYFKRRGLRVVTLVHEFVRMYEDGYLRGLYETSDTVVFPSEAVREGALERHRWIGAKSRVMGQGLLWDHCGALNREECRRRVREELGLAADAFLVVNCGSVDQRKGADLFLDVAGRAEIRRDPAIQFLWIGGGKFQDGTALYWSVWDLERGGAPPNARFAGERTFPAPYLRAADVFLLTSRADPFPCVVQEAMSAEAPVIAFAGSGGAAEALRHGGGILVPYRDTEAMARAVVSLKQDEERRSAIGREGRAAVLKHHRFGDYFAELSELLLDTPSAAPAVARAARQVPRIVFTNSDWGVSGVNTITETLMAGLAGRGWDARLLFTHGRPAEAPALPFEILAAGDPTYETRWRALIDYLESAAPCILAPGYDYFASAVSPALSSRVGVAGVVHSDDPEHYEHAYRLGRYWNRIVAVSERTLERTAALNANFRAVLRLVRSGVDGVPREWPARREGGPLRIVYTGRLVQRQKRILDYLEVAARLEARGVDFTITLAGEGAQEHDLRLMGAELTRRGRVRLPGRLTVAALRAELEAAGVFLLLSEFEGLPVALLEAMGQGCAPVVTAVDSGIGEVIEPGVNGIPIPPGDPAAAAAVLEELSRDAGRRERLGRAAHRTIRERGYLAADMVNGYAAVLGEVWEEIASGQYRRPEAFDHLSPTGKILPPPPLQAHPDRRAG